jgi:hypothetical protein
MNIALLALLLFASPAGSAERSQFPLLPPVACESEDDAQRCAVARPKEWTPDERRFVEDSLRRLMANEVVRGIVAGARANGYPGIRRYSTHTELHPTDGRVPAFSPGFVLFKAKVIGITDAFFAMADVIDPMSGYRFSDLVLLHELIHAFDDRKVSADTEFAALTGWSFRNGRWQYAHRINYSEYQGVVAETRTLYGLARYADAWERDRAFATRMTFAFPTIQSLVNPGESFADILAHLLVDSTAATYLEPDVIAWFERRVLPSLRHRASEASAQP